MLKNLKHLYKYFKKHGLKKTTKEWEYQYTMLETPNQIFFKQLVGYVGAMIATIICMFIFYFNGAWYVSLLLGFGFLIQYTGFKGVLKQRYTLKHMEELYERATEEMENV